MALGNCILCQIAHRTQPAILEWQDDRLCAQHAHEEGVPAETIAAAVEASMPPPRSEFDDLFEPADGWNPAPVKTITPAARVVIESSHHKEPITAFTRAASNNPSLIAQAAHVLDEVIAALQQIGYGPQLAQRAARQSALQNSGFDEIMRGALDLLKRHEADEHMIVAQCESRNARGGRCGSPAVKGSPFCFYHQRQAKQAPATAPVAAPATTKPSETIATQHEAPEVQQETVAALTETTASDEEMKTMNPNDPKMCAAHDCQKEFAPKRKDSRFCSHQCAQREWAHNKRGSDGTTPPARVPRKSKIVPAAVPPAEHEPVDGDGVATICVPVRALDAWWQQRSIEEKAELFTTYISR